MTNEKSVSQSLEEMAQSIVEKSDSDTLGVGKILRQDIALTLEHLYRHRMMHKNQLHSLLKTECNIDTELWEVYRRTPIKSLDPLPDRALLRKQLQKIEQERRRLSFSYEEGMKGLHSRLLELVQKWEKIER